MSVRSWVHLALLLATALMLATPAEARRGFRFGSFGFGGSRSETIDRIADLPDREPYARDGSYWDLGYLHSLSGRDGYVLYLGDKYVRLDDAMLDVITYDLGHNPVAAHRASLGQASSEARPTTANSIERQDGESADAFRARALAMAGQSRAVAPDGAAAQTSSERAGASVAGAIGALFALVTIVPLSLKLRRKWLDRTRAELAEVEDLDDGERASFDDRIAARLRELDAPRTTAAPAPPAARTFGRRTA